MFVSVFIRRMLVSCDTPPIESVFLQKRVQKTTCRLPATPKTHLMSYSLCWWTTSITRTNLNSHQSCNENGNFLKNIKLLHIVIIHLWISQSQINPHRIGCLFVYLNNFFWVASWACSLYTIPYRALETLLATVVCY